MTSRPASSRVCLARIAERVLADEESVRPAAGERHVTRDAGRTIAGVVAAENGAGKIDIDLHLLLADPGAPLEELADQLRREIGGAAAAAGLGERLGAIDVAFEDVLSGAAGEGRR